jgi:hypothetical protein
MEKRFWVQKIEVLRGVSMFWHALHVCFLCKILEISAHQNSKFLYKYDLWIQFSRSVAKNKFEKIFLKKSEKIRQNRLPWR